MLEGSGEIYDILLSEFVGIVRYGEGDRITLEYLPGTEVNQVLEID